jgi:hypothetical protein
VYEVSFLSLLLLLLILEISNNWAPERADSYRSGACRNNNKKTRLIRIVMLVLFYCYSTNKGKINLSVIYKSSYYCNRHYILVLPTMPFLSFSVIDKLPP